MAADSLLGLFTDPEDIRLQLFAPDKNNELRISTKYRIMVEYTPDQERYDPFVFRVSEIYLNRAEAYLRAGEPVKAAADLGAIIARALNKNVDEVSINHQDDDQLMRSIKKSGPGAEFRGHNFFDIVRYKDPLVRGAARCQMSNVSNTPTICSCCPSLSPS